ncbi:MAG: large conductance mechanosensitive channel protein MscL [Nocardiaceae bacterium]|nr:large conductance mechanosensitive channel protein MscL [Nocardiaceae bacterium]
MLKGFKDFLLKGNVVDLAVAVVMGTAFTAIVTAFTKSIIQPLIAAAGGAQNVGLGVQLLDKEPSDPTYATTFIDLGAVITAAINFVMVAFVLYFILVLPITKLKERKKVEGDEAAALTEADLLVEIRDLLAAKSS